MYDRIIVPVNRNERTGDVLSSALRYAATLANDYGAAVYLLETGERSVARLAGTTVDRLSGPARGEPVDVEPLIDTESKAIESHRGDSPWPAELSEYAEDCDADLLVIGVEERRNLREFLFGSPRARVFTATRSAAITVRADETVPQSYPYDSILVPIVAVG